MHASNYIDVKARASALADDEEGNIRGENAMLLARVVKAVHDTNVNVAVGDRIAIAFPDICDRGPGEKIRLFGAEEMLQSFRDRYKQQLTAANGLFMSSVKDTPEDIEGYASFVRVRHSERVTDAGILREQERGARALPKAVLADVGDDEDQIDLHLMKLLKRRLRQRKDLADKVPPYLKMRSSSNGRGFSLHFEKQQKNSLEEGLIDSYGFSRAKEQASLPVF